MLASSSLLRFWALSVPRSSKPETRNCGEDLRLLSASLCPTLHPNQCSMFTVQSKGGERFPAKGHLDMSNIIRLI